MKSLSKLQHQSGNMDIAIFILRISVAMLMLVHGIPKMLTLFSGDPIQFPALVGSPELSLALAVFAEVICSILILLGFATRLAVIPLIITMLIAVLYVHGADPFSKQEMGIHYLVGYVVLFITGSGRFSLDQMIVPKQPTIA